MSSTPAASRLILVGRVAGGFGVRGEVRITAFTEDPLTLKRFKRLLRQDGSPALTLTQARAAKGGIVARCAEVETKEAADALRGLKLFVPREALPAPEEDEFYLVDLIGLVCESPQGERLGTVKSVQDFGAGDLLEILPPDGGATWYLAFTRDTVPEVRPAEGRLIVVRPAEIGEPEPQAEG